MSNWFTNGWAIDAIAIDDRVAQYGDGLFETIAVRDGKARLWQLHVERLQTGCERLGIHSPTADELAAELDSALSQTDTSTDFATAKLVVSAGRSRRGYRREPGQKAIVRVGIFAASEIPKNLYRDGVIVRICSSRLAVQPQLAGIKSMNRLEQVLARSEWDDANVFEGLMRDTAGRLICGTMSNMFIVNESKVMTPALTRCGVSGVMRRHLLSLMQHDGIDCAVRDIEYDELKNASELFLSNSQFGVLPVRRYAQQDLDVGSITKRIQTLAATNGVPECAP
jgi:4-amino-4-deoxychorismate lyase